jgi:hypothetical protein
MLRHSVREAAFSEEPRPGVSSDKYLVRIEASMRIDIDLYRAGNASSPRFDNVRDKDIVKWRDPQSDEIWVKGLSGGISTFSAPRPEQNWWWIRAGTVVPDGLTVTRDRTDKMTGITHYTIRPATDMKLSEFVEKMKRILGVTKLPLERALELGGRWINP